MALEGQLLSELRRYGGPDYADWVFYFMADNNTNWFAAFGYSGVAQIYRATRTAPADETAAAKKWELEQRPLTDAAGAASRPAPYQAQAPRLQACAPLSEGCARSGSATDGPGRRAARPA